MTTLLLELYYERYGRVITYELVDDYFAYLGYNLELEDMISRDLRVYSTSGLMELLENLEDRGY